MKKLHPNSGLVYSTGSGRMCPECRHPIQQCQCKTVSKRPATNGVVRIGRETKGRGGKAVTLVRGVPMEDSELPNLAKKLKTLCGSGGTLKDGVIEIQGDHIEKVMLFLTTQGFSVKRTGG